MITKTIKSELSSELTPLQNQIDYLKIKLDDQEQYSRRTNLKISGIKEQGREENTDDLVLDVINNLILKHQGVSLNYSHIGRTHRVGPPPTTSTKNRPRDIIIRFTVIETLFSGTRKTLNLLMNVNHPTVDFM